MMTLTSRMMMQLSMLKVLNLLLRKMTMKILKPTYSQRGESPCKLP